MKHTKEVGSIEEESLRKRYDYAPNSSIVMQQERSSRAKGKDAQNTGEGESLAGKMKYKFGDRAVIGEDKELQRLKEEMQEQQAEADRRKEIKKHVTQTSDMLGGAEMLMYQPKLRETKVIYQNIVQIVQRYLGDQPQSTIMGAVDEVLAVLKMDNLTDNERKVEIQAMLSKLNEVDWNRLIVLARNLKDYRPDK